MNILPFGNIELLPLSTQLEDNKINHNEKVIALVVEMETLTKLTIDKEVKDFLPDMEKGLSHTLKYGSSIEIGKSISIFTKFIIETYGK